MGIPTILGKLRRVAGMLGLTLVLATKSGGNCEDKKLMLVSVEARELRRL